MAGDIFEKHMGSDRGEKKGSKMLKDHEWEANAEGGEDDGWKLRSALADEHDRTVVEYIAINNCGIISSERVEAFSAKANLDLVVYRVVKAHREPREIWVVFDYLGRAACLNHTQDEAEEAVKWAKGRSYAKFCEVLD